MRRRISLRVQLLLLQVVIVLTAVAAVGVAATLIQARQIRASYEQQMVGVAESVARLPSVKQAFAHPKPSDEIQPIAELIRKASGVTYVVVTDSKGIRYSHPDPERIGKMVSTDPSVPLSGRTYVGTQTGTLGESWRVKVPVFGDDGAVIGSVSVGILESQLRADLLAQLPRLVPWVVGAALLGLLGAYWVSRLVWRRIHRLEPEEIAALLETRDAMLHSIGEGFVAVDDHGRLALVNDEAVRLLGVPPGSEGRPAAEVLDAGILEVLAAAPGESRLVLVGERILVAQRSDAIVDGARVGTVLICRDRTELHTVLRDLDGVRDLTSALRAQAHEFANVMHTVSGLIELGHPGEAVDFISRSGYGGALTDNTLVPGVTDPAVTALLMAKRSTARECGVALVVDPGSVCGADGSSDVVTVLGNLIDNAVAAAGLGGTVSVALRAGAEADGPVTTIVVEDDGPGVAESDRERIFTSGYTTSDGAARGIGLALVDRIARRRGGRVSVGSAASGGARFEVRLPAPLLEGSGGVR
ncbi:ATP-binding protein [Nocardioides terrae]|nr:sensor histidine kinase [Nocardioides terrae]